MTEQPSRSVFILRILTTPLLVVLFIICDYEYVHAFSLCLFTRHQPLSHSDSQMSPYLTISLNELCKQNYSSDNKNVEGYKVNKINNTINIYMNNVSDEINSPNLTNHNKTTAKVIVLHIEPPEEEGYLNNSLAFSNDTYISTLPNWNKELSILRSRIRDKKANKSITPAYALFRKLTFEPYRESLLKFMTSANPEVVSTMTISLSALFGGLINSNTMPLQVQGIATNIKGHGDTLAQMCFRLQTTGYIFRNIEYVLALHEILGIDTYADSERIRQVFQNLDIDRNGYLELNEIKNLLEGAYGTQKDVPYFEISTFLIFFDENLDGRISSYEFERALRCFAQQQTIDQRLLRYQTWKQYGLRQLGEFTTNIGEDNDNISLNTTVSGNVFVEFTNGTNEIMGIYKYMQSLQHEAQKLRAELKRESFVRTFIPSLRSGNNVPTVFLPGGEDISTGGRISSHLASLEGDVTGLTKRISKDVMGAMNLFIEYILNKQTNFLGSVSPDIDIQRRLNTGVPTAITPEMLEVEMSGSSLQQLALWQMMIGYKMREEEATGEYKKLIM